MAKGKPTEVNKPSFAREQKAATELLPGSEESGETPKQDGTPAAIWSCEARAIDTEPVTALDELYVGDKYLLHCKGDVVVSFDRDQAVLLFDQKEKNYSFYLLSLRTLDEDDFWAEVTSYKPGEHSFKGVSLTDGTTSISLSGEKAVTIKSALQERPQQESMNPEAQAIKYFGPFTLSLPLWVWGCLIGLGLFIFVVSWKVISRRRQKIKLKDKLSKHATALSPYHQFHKEVREHIRKYSSPGSSPPSPQEYIGEVDTSFRMFLVREFLIPATEWGTSSVMSELKSQHKNTYRYAGPGVRKLLLEFERAKFAGDKNKIEDCEQMIDMARRVVDQIQKLRRVKT